MLFNSEKLTAVYFYCAIFGSVVFILKTALPIDSGTEVHGDFTSVTDTDSSFSLFTVESVAAFFMCGGWMGWFSFAWLHYELKISMLVAFVSAVLGMVFFTWLITQFKKLEHSPKPCLKELLGRSGKAYMQFAPKGAGKIQIEFNSKLEILDARNDTDEKISSFEPVKVIRMENGNIYISKEKD